VIAENPVAEAGQQRRSAGDQAISGSTAGALRPSSRKAAQPGDTPRYCPNQSTPGGSSHRLLRRESGRGPGLGQVQLARGLQALAMPARNTLLGLSCATGAGLGSAEARSCGQPLDQRTLNPHCVTQRLQQAPAKNVLKGKRSAGSLTCCFEPRNGPTASSCHIGAQALLLAGRGPAGQANGGKAVLSV